MTASIGMGAAILFIAVSTVAQAPDQSGQIGTKQPHIVGSPLNWISNNDYPSAALREGRQGRARYKLTIDSSGRVSNCEITSSSGHADLDAQTCRVLSRRARFVKAAESDQLRYFESAFSWNILR